MAFQRTLRYVQLTRGAATLFAMVSFVLYLIVFQEREKARADIVKQILDAAEDGMFDVGSPAHAAWGSLSLVALGVSMLWNGLSFFDLTVKKHYRFGRRIYIFVDIIAAIALLIFGFLNFLYDAVIYYALEIASHEQYQMEMAAIVFLGLCCVAHLGFFCYGCKDPAVSNFNIENAPLADGGAAHNYAQVTPSRRRSTSMTSMDEEQELDDVDLDKKDEAWMGEREIRVVIRR